MKKHLIALAVAGAVAVPAMAQNVTVYGTIGAAWVGTNTGGTKADSVNNDSYKTQAVGIRGTEDLGGGLKAYFDMAGDTESKSSAFGFNRANYLGLSSSMGAIEVGRLSTETERYYGFANSGANLFLPSNDIGGKKGGAVRYAAPTIGNVSVAITTLNNNDGNGANTQDAVTDVSAVYSAGNIKVGMVSATGKTDSATFLFGSYNLGFAEVAVSNQKRELSNVNSTYNQVGVVVPLAGGMQARANYLKYSVDGSTTADYKQLGAMITKDLSKRTSVYAGITNRDLATTGTDVDTTVVGIIHSF